MKMPKTQEQRAAKKVYDLRRRATLKGLNPKPPKRLRSRYRFINDGDRSSLTAHKAIVEKAIGRPLPKGAEIHHVDNDGHNNDNGNLVVCQDHAYHALLHRRTAARDACGNANWYKCVFCKQWDYPRNLTLYVPKDQTTPRANHPRCSTEYAQKRRKEVLHADCAV